MFQWTLQPAWSSASEGTMSSSASLAPTVAESFHPLCRSPWSSPREFFSPSKMAAPAWCPLFVPLSTTQSLLPSTFSSVAAVAPSPHQPPSNGCTAQLSKDSSELRRHQSQSRPPLMPPATETAPPTSPPTAWGRATLPVRSCATRAGVGATIWTGQPSVNMQGGRQAIKAIKVIKVTKATKDIGDKMDIGDTMDTTVRAIRDKIVQWETWLSKSRRHFLSILASYIFWIQRS